MKRLLLIIFFFPITSLQAQNHSAFDSLKNQFEELYLIAGKDPTQNYFERLSYAAQVGFNIRNPLFRKVKLAFSSKFPGKDNKWLIEKITDSIVSLSTDSLLLKGEEELVEKAKTVLQLYKEKLCDCVTSRLEQNKKADLSKTVNDCEVELIKDQSFKTRMSVNTITLTNQEKLKLQSLSSKYIYLHCPVWNSYFNDILKASTYDQYLSGIYYIINEAGSIAVDLYNRNRLDSLNLFFPNYKTYQVSLKQSKNLYHKASYSRDIDEKDGASIITQTFFDSKNKQTKLLGQVVYKVEIKNDEIMVSSFTFITPEKIKDKQKYIKRWEEIKDIPPPPDVEIIN